MSGERVQEGSGRQVGLTFPEAIGALPQNCGKVQPRLVDMDL